MTDDPTDEEVNEPAENEETPETEETTENDDPVEEEEVVEEDDNTDILENCACMDWHGQAVTFPLDGGAHLSLSYAGRDYEYPWNYGTSCEAWNTDLGPDCLDNAYEQFCTEKWCFVSSDCTASDVEESWYFDDLYYSFESCVDV